MAEQPIFPEQSAEVIQAMEEENAYALNYDSLTQKERAAAPGAFLLSLDEAKLLHKAAGAYADVLTKYIRLTDEEIYTPEMQVRLRDESKAAIEGAGINKAALIDICRKLITGHYWTYEIISIDFSDDSLTYEVTTDRDKKPRTVTKGTAPDFYKEGKTISEKAAALGIPIDTLYITSLDRSQINSISNIYTDEIIPTSPQRLPAIAPVPHNQAIVQWQRVANNQPKTKNTMPPPLTPRHHGEKISRRITEKGYLEERITTDNSEVTITNLSPFGFGRNPNAQEIIEYLFAQLTQQSTNGIPPEEFTIDLKELVDLGAYTRIDNAKRGVIDALKYAQVWYIDFENKKTGAAEGGGTIFGRYQKFPNTSIMTIKVGDLIKPGFIFPYAKIPIAWLLSINPIAGAMTSYIFRLMRNSSNKVKNNKLQISVSINTVRDQIGIPTVQEVKQHHNRRYNDFIKNPIIQAVDEINQTAKNNKKINGELLLKITAPNDEKIESWITGKIQITATGEYISGLEKIEQPQKLKGKKAPL